MDLAGVLLTVAIASFFAGAPLSLIRRDLGYLTTFGAALLFGAVAVDALLFGPVRGAAWGGPLGDVETLSLDALSAFFALATSVVWAATSVYSVWYDDRPSPVLAVTYALTLGAIALLVTASSEVLFLIGWETMTLASYGMILEARGRTDRVYSAAFVFLAFGEASTLLVLLAFAGLFVGTGSLAFGPTLSGTVLPSLVFVAGLLGFGLKMGTAPFHMSEWLPIAHSSAPSNASAVLSSTLTLAGAYGLFRLVSLLPGPPDWWGALTLAIGAISVLLGALFAAVSEHSKGLPAYSTIENNGLILVALGVSLLAGANHLTLLAVFALFAAFYQALAHALAKTVLFLSAGYVEHLTRTFDLSSVEGRATGPDRAALVGTLAASLSLAAGPPLAGFVSEWMVLEALFQSYRFGETWAQFVGLLTGAAVALGAGLITVAMVKFVGFAYLWKPRCARAPSERGSLGPVVGAVAFAVLTVGITAPWILVLLAPSVSVVMGSSVAAPIGGLLSVPNGWSILSGAPFGILSPPMVPIAIAAGVLVAVGYDRLGRHRAVRRVPVWMAGSAPAREGETYTSFGYSTGIRLMMSSALRTREVRANAGAITTVGFEAVEPYSVELEVFDVFKLFYDGLLVVGEGVSRVLKERVMPGQLGRYLAYVLVAVLVVVVYIASVST